MRRYENDMSTPAEPRQPRAFDPDDPSLVAEPFAGPVPPARGILLDRGNGVIRVDIAGRALKEEAEHLPAELGLHHAAHRGRKIGRVFQVIRTEHDRVARIVHQHGHWASIRAIDSQH